MSATTNGSKLKQTTLDGFHQLYQKRANGKPPEKLIELESSKKHLTSSAFYNGCLQEKLRKIIEENGTQVDEPMSEGFDDKEVIVNNVEHIEAEIRVIDDAEEANDICMNVACENEVSAHYYALFL